MSQHQHPPRRVYTPGASRKRKDAERENGLYSFKKPAPLPSAYPAPKPVWVTEPVSSNRFLAGYMAYEFLTNGTLFGQQFNPARPETEPNKIKQEAVEAEPTTAAHNSYADVARIFRHPGTHVPGVINPTQLARWIQM